MSDKHEFDEFEKWFNQRISFEKPTSEAYSLAWEAWQIRADLAKPSEWISVGKNTGRPWPLEDVINKLIEAANILLNDKSYDGHGYEQIMAARDEATKILKAL